MQRDSFRMQPPARKRHPSSPVQVLVRDPTCDDVQALEIGCESACSIRLEEPPVKLDEHSALRVHVDHLVSAREQGGRNPRLGQCADDQITLAMISASGRLPIPSRKRGYLLLRGS